MFVFTENSAKRELSAWEKEVRKRLIERNMKQVDLISHLNKSGFKVTKQILYQILSGNVTNARRGEISEINKLLGISSA